MPSPKSTKKKECIKIHLGINKGKVGDVVGLDLTQTVPFYFVDFGDGTDELLAESVLDHMLRAV